MQRYLPLLLFVAGMFLMFAGFIYDLVYAGIPNQDPTPEMSANYTRNSKIASGIQWSGFGVLLLGIVFGFLRMLSRRSKPKTAS